MPKWMPSFSLCGAASAAEGCSNSGPHFLQYLGNCPPTDFSCTDMDRECHPLNPVAASCQMAEDFINRAATLTRVVNSKALAWRTFELYKMAVSDALKEA